ncbi:sensor histidine kinase [Pseudonocardia lacus]|uniref:sensor histidine kinase n=1 Tax=Pseudonocardia lacus TaxID=2835865 RepID=UPI0027E2AFA5|nr:ATP-binding protein [Pseudonocardia lacus]
MAAITVSFISSAGRAAASTRPRRGPSLAGRLFALQAAVVVVVLAGFTTATWLQLGQATDDATTREMLSIARTLADAPEVRDAVDDPDPSAVLQPLAERVRLDTATDFVVVMSPTGQRWSHPNPELIGERFIGTIGPAADGGFVTETYTGTLGPSVRAVVPVLDRGRVVALVSAGRTLSAVSRELQRQIPVVVGVGAAALGVAAAGSWLVSRWLRRATHDLGPAELSRMYEYYDAVLHAVREGLLLLDGDGRVQMVNDEARRLLALPGDVGGRAVDELGLPPALGAALAAGTGGSDEIYLTADRIVVVSQAAARWSGRRLGSVVTLRDRTELRELVTELRTVRGVADSLSSQAHEAANQLHTVLALIEMGRAEEALEFATGGPAQRLVDGVVAGIGTPELAALVLAKAGEAEARGVELVVADGTALPAGLADPHDLVTIVGNLLDNAIDAAAAPDAPRPRWVRIGAEVVGPGAGVAGAPEVVLRIADSGPGVAAADVERMFGRGWTTKPAVDGRARGIGLALVDRAVRRHGGDVRVSTERGSEFVVRLPLVVT